MLLIFGPGSGGRTVVGLDRATQRPVFALDLRSYAAPPVAVPGAAVDETVQWAAEAEGLLFVSTFHNTYAKSSGGRNGYITALEPQTGKLVWRSRPLVGNARTFVVVGNALVTGYGFTAEPDSLYVLDRQTGAVAQTLRLRSAPEYLILKDDRLFVRTYNTDYVFRLRKERTAQNCAVKPP